MELDWLNYPKPREISRPATTLLHPSHTPYPFDRYRTNNTTTPHETIMDTQLHPETHISPDRFKRTILPAQQGAEADHSPVVIYMISGNPGLISYYHGFLSTLADRLSSLSTEQGIRSKFHIYGHSLSGFEVEESSAGNGNGSTTQPCSLEEQICFVQRKLDSFIGGLEVVGPRRVKVILVGHSVGSYIAMEVLRRHRERSDAASTSSSSGAVGFDIIGGAMLFPTVVDIALSPSGRKLTVALSSSATFTPCALNKWLTQSRISSLSYRSWLC